MIHSFAKIVVCLLLLSACTMAQHVHDLHPTTVHDDLYKRVSLEDGETTLKFVMPNPGESWNMIFDERLTNRSNLVGSAKYSTTRSFISSATVTKSLAVSGEISWKSNMLITGAEAKLGFVGTLTGTDTTSKSEIMNVDLTLPLPACARVRVWKKVKIKTLGANFDAWDHKITCQSTRTSERFHTYCNREVVYVSGRSFELGETTIEPVEALPASECMTSTTLIPPTTPPTTPLPTIPPLNPSSTPPTTTLPPPTPPLSPPMTTTPPPSTSTTIPPLSPSTATTPQVVSPTLIP